MLIAVTGANGFLGRAVAERAVARGHEVRAIVRSGEMAAARETLAVGDLARADAAALFGGVDAVIHLAARVHVLRETAADPALAFMQANRDLTLRLAEGAARAGVGRFVQASSAAALVSVTPVGEVADDVTRPAPQNAYGRSKLAADLALAAADFGAMTVLSLRPPTIYGPGVGAFFARLMRVARLGVPLPIGGFDNRRSFLYLGNAADAFVLGAEARAEGSFLVTDSPPMTTAELYRALLRACGKSDWVPALPTAPVDAIARVVLGDRADSLLGSAAFDGSRFARTFGWRPPVGFEQAIRETVAA